MLLPWCCLCVCALTLLVDGWQHLPSVFVEGDAFFSRLVSLWAAWTRRALAWRLNLWRVAWRGLTCRGLVCFSFFVCFCVSCLFFSLRDAAVVAVRSSSLADERDMLAG